MRTTFLMAWLTAATSFAAVDSPLEQGGWLSRRAGDERLFLAPTALTLAPGEVTAGSDELLLFHVGAGLSRRVELNALFGVLPIPFAGGTPFLMPGMYVGVAGAGVVVAGAAELGVKVLIFNESEYVPAVSAGYSVLDTFCGLVGVGAAAGIVGPAAGVGVGVGGGLVNLQFNLFSAQATKHFGATSVTAGSYLLDNHHFLPQTAGFVVGGAVGGIGESSGAGGGAFSRGTSVSMLPDVVQPFAGVEHELGPHSALAAELFPRLPLRDSFGSTGVRWVLGPSHPLGPVPLQRLKLRVDLAGIWAYVPPSGSRAYGLVLPTPYLGLGGYFL